METYVMKKKNKNKKIIKMNDNRKGFQFKPNIKNPNLVKMNNLEILDFHLTHVILNKKIEKSFRKLALMILNALNDADDETGSGIAIALDEISKQKSIIQNKYADYLKKQDTEKYLKRLTVFEAEAKQKLMLLQMQEELLEKEKSHGR